MRERILKSLAIVTPIAVFCSLQFGHPASGPVSSVLDPLLPAPASALDNYWCGGYSYCPQPYSGCASFQNPSSYCQQWTEGSPPVWHCQSVPHC